MSASDRNLGVRVLERNGPALLEEFPHPLLDECIDDADFLSEHWVHYVAEKALKLGF